VVTIAHGDPLGAECGREKAELGPLQ
jgi:hypothetical protein